MDNLLAVQLVTSFVVGGGFVAFLSFAAERASKRVAGLILALPSTFAIALFFIGWVNSPEVAASIVPASIALLGVAIFYLVVYVYTAKYFSKFRMNRLIQIFLTFFITVLVWFVLDAPFAVSKPTNLFFTIPVYLIIISITHYFLSVKPKIVEKKVRIQYTVVQKISRAVFAGFVITLSVLLSRTLDPFWGAIFANFPVAFASTLIILHWYHSPEFLFQITKNASFGSLSIVFYGLAVMIFFPLYGIVIGTILAFLISLLFFYIITKLKRQTVE